MADEKFKKLKFLRDLQRDGRTVPQATDIFTAQKNFHYQDPSVLNLMGMEVWGTLPTIGQCCVNVKAAISGKTQKGTSHALIRCTFTCEYR